jgi:hypothetical protein
MSDQPLQDQFDRRIGFVIDLALFLSSAVILLPVKFLQDPDKGASLRFIVCYVALWTVILVLHYVVPSLYQRLDLSDEEAVQRTPYRPRHFYRDIHSGLFLGLNSFAWVSLLAATWAAGDSINSVTYAAFANGWGFLVLIWIVVFVVHLCIVAWLDKRAGRRAITRG